MEDKMLIKIAAQQEVILSRISSVESHLGKLNGGLEKNQDKAQKNTESLIVATKSIEQLYTQHSDFLGQLNDYKHDARKVETRLTDHEKIMLERLGKKTEKALSRWIDAAWKVSIGVIMAYVIPKLFE